MLKGFEYTTLAQRYTAKFPILTYVMTQVSYWIIVNLLLVIIVHLQSKIIGQQRDLPMSVGFAPPMFGAILLGILYGVILGFAGYWLDRNYFRKISLGKIILIKALGSVTLLALLLLLLRYILFDTLITPALYNQPITLSEKSWRYVFYLLLIYYFFMTLIINFVNQVNKKFGPGVLAPLLLGWYRDPKEEERIFMFMDLKSSTTAAEKLGHLKYSAFIRDCFLDINEILFAFQAQVYQYVGDEIVVMWPQGEGIKNQSCIRFFFACKRQFHYKVDYYMANYGVVPTFKAGVHTGKVTAVEIGEIKKDIAYHGDTLNTAARIQGVCNEYNRDFLVSEHLISKIAKDHEIKIEDLGTVLLKGKTEKIGIVSVSIVGE